MSATVLHASGFIHDDRVTGVKLTSYDGRMEDVVPGIIELMRQQGHGVEVCRTWPIDNIGRELVEVNAFVKVMHDGEQVGSMWHVFTYPSEQWKSALPVPSASTTGEQPK